MEDLLNLIDSSDFSLAAPPISPVSYKSGVSFFIGLVNNSKTCKKCSWSYYIGAATQLHNFPNYGVMHGFSSVCKQ